MSLFTEDEFQKCVDRYKGDRHAIKFNCRDQFMVMNFAQFTDRSSLRDIETTLNLCGDLYRFGIKTMPKSTLAEANEKKDWRIFQDFAMTLVKEATALYKDEKLRIGLEEMIYAFDCTTIDAYFDYWFGPLAWWALSFEHEVLDTPNWQGNAVVNIQIGRFLTCERSSISPSSVLVMLFYENPKTVVAREYSSKWKSGMEPFFQ